MSDFGDGVKARMQVMADALDISELDSVTDQVRAPVRTDEIAGIIARYGFGSESPKGTYPEGYPITFPGVYPGFGTKLPGVAYRTDTFLDFLLRALGAEISGMFGLGATWFEWNGTDLSQFDAVVQGSQVASGGASVIASAGVNWVQITSTATGVPTSDISAATVLPISIAPPSANYIVLADFISVVQAGTVVGAYILSRFTSTSSAYLVRFQSGSTPHEANKLTAGETISQLGVSQSDPGPIAVGTGMSIGISVDGASIVKPQFGEIQVIADTTSPIAAAGQAAIGVSPGNTGGATTTCAFRNIRCIEVL